MRDRARFHPQSSLRSGCRGAVRARPYSRGPRGPRSGPGSARPAQGLGSGPREAALRRGSARGLRLKRAAAGRCHGLGRDTAPVPLAARPSDDRLQRGLSRSLRLRRRWFGCDGDGLAGRAGARYRLSGCRPLSGRASGRATTTCSGCRRATTTCRQAILSAEAGMVQGQHDGTVRHPLNVSGAHARNARARRFFSIQIDSF